MTQWRLEALTPPTRRAADLIRRSGTHEGFYLVGGTAAALQLGHRFSEDLDFFSAPRELKPPERERLLQQLGTGATVEVLHQADGWLQLIVQGVSTTFLWYKYPLVHDSLDWDGIQVADLTDIALMKINAIVGRGTKRDFLDLYAICQTHKLVDLLPLTEKKFVGHRDFLVQASFALTYFDDADKDQRMPRMIRQMDWEKVKGFFLREVPKAFGKLTAP